MKISPRFKNRWLNQSSILIVGIIAFLGLAVGWSFWAELDQVSRAPGQVIPTGRIQVIQSTDGGQIERILVREGDRVKEGQLLVRLEDVKLRASVGEARGKVASLMGSMARINAELFDRPLEFPSEVRDFPEFVSNQTMLYNKRRQALNDQLTSLRQMLGLMKQELDMNMPLLEQGDVSRADVLRLQRGVSDIQSQIVNVRNKYLQDLQAEYTKTEEDLVTAREILAQRTDALEDTEIRAPVDGIIKDINLTTVGGVLRPSDEVLSIVPTGDELIVEAKMSPSDVAYVRTGQPASVKFDAYDASIYGSALGEVTYISPDTLTEQTQQGESVYYRVHITVDTSPMKPHLPGEVIEIQPGMTSTAEIQTGRNTVWRYLTKPINKTMSEALTER
ncbi:HlyD family type I secretion periplasmic adaptor subunit [Novosphingobium marinum]|uniref:Adhesin transport system membrane fusion protein n=1 Tax=Novosphingobium marinum TaxID=1514948 RepID=A0A7Y9XZ08_9SPHN|nr:HlyD family efflux transporter periplasmic adaptor subunit [Novosphingobium marinum]NYH95698.1 adhesin transport system membrane fusion protein [Novosphingobium marinum]GGC29143.1 HlyD family type I secretion periplasmic adaptor subunit [Novosphingobium marinum]